MKTLDSVFEAHLESKRWQLCTALILDLTDGTTVGFTDHQTAMLVDSVTCNTASAYTGKALQAKADLSVGNSEIDVLLSSAGIDEGDVQGGRYSFARYRFYLVKYTEPIKWHKISAGWLGEAQTGGPIARIEMRDLGQALQGRQGEVTSSTCRASLGDVRCGVALATHTVTGSITSIVEDKVIFTDSARTESLNHFSYGKCTFTTGAENAGLSMEVKASTSGGRITLAAPMAKGFATGDPYSMSRGCNRLSTTCKSVFNNLNRMRAEIFLIGDDEFAKFARQ